MNLDDLHNEKLAAYSRENDKPDICCECDECPDTCGYNSEDCLQRAAEAAAEDRFDALREL